MGQIWRDVKAAVRQIRRAAMLSGAVMLIVALSIGVFTSLFGAYDALALRPLSVSGARHLVMLDAVDRRGRSIGLDQGTLQAIGVDGDVVRSAAGYLGTGAATADAGSGPERVAWEGVTGTYFDTIGVRPFLGRALSRADDAPGRTPVVMLGYGFWQRGFGGAQTAVGRTLRFEGVPCTVAGVLPPSFTGLQVGASVDVVVPIAAVPRLLHLPSERSVPLTFGLFRLRNDRSIEQARAWITAAWPHALAEALPAGLTPDARTAFSSRIPRVRSAATGFSLLRDRYAPTLQLLIALALCMLMVATLNVAGLCLARAVARRREFEVRLAMGAGPADLIRLLVIESVLMCAAGAAAGFPLALWAARLLSDSFDVGLLSLTATIAPDLRIGTTVATGALLVGTVAGLLPAWTIIRARALGASGARGATTAASRWTRALVVAQCALSLAGLIAAALLVRSLTALRNSDPAFDRDHVIAAVVDRVDSTESSARDDFAPLLERLAAVPGFRSAALASQIPNAPTDVWPTQTVALADRPDGPADVSADYVSDDFFSTLEIPLVSGRAIDARDGPGARLVAVVSQTAARRLDASRSVVGREVRLGASGARVEIVGVSRDAALQGPRDAHPSMIFLSRRQFPLYGRSPVVLARVDGPSSPAVLRRAIVSSGGLVPVATTSLRDEASRALLRDRMSALLAASFGVLTLMFSGAGLFGLLAQGVVRRRRELGVRLALGASPSTVRRLVVRQSMGLVLLALPPGVALGAIAARALQSRLFEVRPLDGLSFAASAAVLAGVALLAAYAPARRASTIDPADALRD